MYNKNFSQVLKQISREIVNVSTVHSESLYHTIVYEREKREELIIAVSYTLKFSIPKDSSIWSKLSSDETVCIFRR